MAQRLTTKDPTISRALDRISWGRPRVHKGRFIVPSSYHPPRQLGSVWFPAIAVHGKGAEGYMDTLVLGKDVFLSQFKVHLASRDPFQL